MPAELAANTTMPAVTLQEPHVVAMKTAPLKAQKPTNEEVEVAEVFAISAPAPADPAPAPALPATASNLPLIAAAGLLCLLSALCLRMAATKQDVR